MPTRAEHRQRRRAKAAEALMRSRNAHFGTRHVNSGPDLKLLAEWDSTDGLRVRQILCLPNPNEPGHFIGVVEVLGFSLDFEKLPS